LRGVRQGRALRARLIVVIVPEAHVITESLARNRNSKTKTAKELRLTRGQLNYRLKMIKQMIK